MMVFNVCVNDSVQLLYLNLLMEEMLVMIFDWSCDSHLCCDDCWLSVISDTVSILRWVGKLTLYQIMKYGFITVNFKISL